MQYTYEAEKQKVEDDAKVALLGKLRPTCLLQLKSWHAENKGIAEKIIAGTAELWVLRQDEFAMQHVEIVEAGFVVAKQ